MKRKNTSSSFEVFVVDQLSELGTVTSRKMFGGVGLYCDDRFFGLIAHDQLYLKVDDSNRGVNRLEVVDAASGRLLYSRGYSTIFGEWQTTDEAKSLARSFQESLRFPMPSAPVDVRVMKRDAANAFVPAWSVRIDPNALDVQRRRSRSRSTTAAIPPARWTC